MFNFFDTIIDMLSAVINFVSGIIESIIFVFTFLTQGFFYFGSVAVFIPDFCYAFVVGALAYILIITIINLGA